MSERIIQIVLILAPMLLALSIGAYYRLRRHVYSSREPIAYFRHFRWNSFLIAVGGFYLSIGAARADAMGLIAQIFGFFLALEFFYVSYLNIQVVMSDKGLLMGMNYSPWNRFAGYHWISDRELELKGHSRRRYRLKVPEHVKTHVEEIVDLNILR